MNPSVPVFVLVGRPNTGKSTLFNRLTGTRSALVADYAGLTRDRQYGQCCFAGKRYIVIDTGGLVPDATDPLAVLAEQQAELALAEADRILFLVDARAGLLPPDEGIARSLRRLGKPITVLANKAEGLQDSASAEFFALGLGRPELISAEHGDGVEKLLRILLKPDKPESVAQAPSDSELVRMAIVGRPNVGKSTLANRLLGEERLLASDLPGTTRDAIAVPFFWNNQQIELVDTAGIRRRARISEAIEKFSIVKALQAIEKSHVAVLVVDARDDISSHDARLMGLIAERGRAMVLAVNKWDSLSTGRRREVRKLIDYRLPFLDYVPVHTVSALHGSGLRELMNDVVAAYLASNSNISTPELNRVLVAAVARHPPHAVLGRRIKLRYAHQCGCDPLTIMIHGNQTEKIKDTYKSYLANVFRRAFKLSGVPIKLEFKTSDNPFRNGGLSGQKNKLRHQGTAGSAARH